jgi:catechol 2,3-dioxygenase-like lactoylglutathione lyase family enzyme
VDRFRREFLDARGVPTLYGTPRDFPEYSPGYYAVFFEDPDRLKLEVAHVPPRG